MTNKYFYLLFLCIIPSLLTAQKFCGFDEYHEAVTERYGSTIDSFESQFRNFSKSNKAIAGKTTYNTVTIPVVFHVVHNGEPIGQGANVSGGKIYEQLAILNNNFNAVASGSKVGFGSPTNPKFQFCLAKTDPFGQSSTGITRTYGSDFYTINTIDPRDEDRLIKSINWNPQIYLNVYITDLRPVGDSSNLYAIAGYSSFPVVPDILQGTTTTQQNILRQLIDGIVLNHRYVGAQAGRPSDTDGHVLAHEVGHWLGLFHVFNTSECDLSSINIPDCTKYGDKVCDTPILEEASLGNTLFPDEEVLDCLGDLASAENFMDYNTSLDFFTEEQVDIMHQKASFYRSLIYNQTYLNADCTVNIGGTGGSGGSGGFGESGSCNGAGSDSYAFKIKSDVEDSGFGKVLSLDYDELVISNPIAQKLNFFNIDGCSISSNGELEMPNIAIENVLLKDGFLFVSTNVSIFIFEKNQNQTWTQIQQISGDNKFGINMAYRDNTLVITSERYLYIYEYNGFNFSHIDDFYVVSTQDYIDINALQFNGEIIAVESGDNRLSRQVYFYAKNTSGNFEAVNSNLTIIAETIVLTEAPENLLYTYRWTLANSNNQHVTTYDLNSLAQGGSNIVKLNEVLDFNLFDGNSNWNDPLSFHVYNEYLLMLSNTGTSFHKRETPNYDLVTVYDGNNNSYLQPNPHAAATSLSKSSDLSGNLLVVGNSYCGEVYIYALSNFLNYSNSDLSLCSHPTTDYLEGKSISVGGNSCNVDIDERLDLKAKETITIGPNTHIKNGAIFSAKTSSEPNCNLSGGLLIDTGSSSKADSGYDEPFIHNPIQIRVKTETRKKDDDIYLKGLTIHPNPTRGILKIISSKDNLVLSATIYGLNNTRLLSYENKERLSSSELDLSTFPVGIFILNLTMEDGSIVSKKVIKE
ncbi:zinc-dependent metalloprotease [Maribacter sp. 2304DJ31-5]|uniref:zinc-dependent metalloprotease n=1 Tax=Maribacter sp. 2304DJ31-5 TaxID=3386273 RepID=UPI0039BCD14A